MKQCVYVTLVATLLSACAARKEKADLLIHHAMIYTADSMNTVAAAMAVKDGKILMVGTNELVQRSFDADSVIDAKGAAVFPGFNDAHAHFFGYANSLRSVDLVGAKSWDEAVARVRDFAAEHPSAWVLGRGWDQNDWEVKTFPDKSKLDSLFPNTPVLLERIDGHASIANQAALDAAGVKAGQTIAGGTIETKNGRLTGILVDNADELVSSKIPAAPLEEIIASLEAAERNCLAAGLTSITDCGLDLDAMHLLDTLLAQRKLHLRLNVMLSDNEENISWLLKNGVYEKDRLLVRSVKFYGDGALGSRGACLKHDYTDRPGWKGFLLKDARYFAEKAALLAETDIQMCTHAIGDSANGVILKIYADALKGKNDKRWRIEHAQVVDSIDFHWFGENNIVPSVQPTHATSDMYWAKDRLGPQRVRFAYAFQQLLRQNGWLPLGTDFPVEHIDPLRTFYAAVARKDQAGYPEGGFQPENALSREEALKGMTIWAARASFEEEKKGSLEPGKAADFVVLDQDTMKVPAEKILATKVLATYIYGQALHRAGL
ncbi:amidohydrolase [Chitinophaga sp. GCM10012297]|uniref:Amidohydrolase n=1 Tax=Chitinophaga chungangae TaxID=2821488 RepID=A0ABS3YEX4_9BACT|nr:amidohydrolase [Chitinophaga chungangae]MBO9153237.1 amidohydrolase [Chitinophaga chungangae]